MKHRMMLDGTMSQRRPTRVDRYQRQGLDPLQHLLTLAEHRLRSPVSNRPNPNLELGSP